MTAEEFIQEIVQEGCTATIKPLLEDQFVEGGTPESGYNIKIDKNLRSQSYVSL